MSNQVGLYRSPNNQMIAGVMGGIAERFGWNANGLRIIFVLVSCLSAAFPGIIVYLCLWLLLPKIDPEQRQTRTIEHS
ncbi:MULTISPECIES: PspC domain-containing protein [unclassified Acinetobacter]|uniref:PspC domain-containing protein n=1 Tax=unclassified Acinetobacter TaxID=196816 RepID=UPI0035BA3F62